MDAASEKAMGDAKSGTTGEELGRLSDKVSRHGLRVGDLFHNFEENTGTPLYPQGKTKSLRLGRGTS